MNCRIEKCGKCCKQIVRCECPLAPSPIGNGADGDVDLCANPNAIPNPLDRDYYFNNLRLCLPCLNTGGFRIFIRDTLTFESGGICNNGGNGSAAAAGTGTPVGTTGRSTNGGIGLGGHGENSDQPNVGGIGGFGKYPPGIPLAFPPSSGGPVIFNSFPQNTLVRQLNGNPIWGGTGGGGDDGLAPGGVAVGGGGGGGGIIVVSAYRIRGTGFIQARGGNGSQTGRTGGGGGGAIVLNYLIKDPDSNITLDVQGGTGFNGGSNGANGNIFIVKISPPLQPITPSV